MPPAEPIELVARRYLAGDAPIVYLVLDDSGKILERNAYATRLFGDPPPQTFAEMIIAPRAGIDIAEHRGAGEVLLSLPARDRMPRSFRFSFFAVDDAMTLALGRPDLEELERLNRDVLRLNAELAASERALGKSNADLERLVRLKDQFLGMAAHDLRKPLGLVLSWADLALDDEALDPGGRKALDRVSSAARTMRQMIDNFLTVAVIEAGQLSLDPRSAEVREIVDGALELVEIIARRRQIAVSCDLPEDLPRLFVDSPKLQQALTNLLDNAVEHAPQGSTVLLTAHSRDDSLILAVENEGSPIPEDVIGRLFRPFEKGGNAPGDRTGTGLGLAIAHAITKLHGGRIDVRSEATTRFEIEVPLRVETERRKG